MKLKVLHIVDSLNIGGLENGVVNLINNASDDIEHAICCLRQGGPMAERIVRPNVPVRIIGSQGRNHLLAWTLRDVIRDTRPDIVHTRNWGTIDGIVGARLAGVKHIVHGEHGRDCIDIDGLNRKRNLLRRLLSGKVSRFVTVSADLKRWLAGTVGIAPGKIQVIINGVDTEKFSPAADSRADYKARLGCAPDTILIGSVGRLDEIKNYPIFIKAMTELAACGLHCQGIIVGDGPEHGGLERLIAESRAPVVLAGKRDDVASCLRAFDIFVLPSLNEGISNTILEAMACGLPIVAMRAGGNPELVEDGVSGFLVGNGDRPELVRALHQLSNDFALRKTMGSAARQHSRRLFSLQRMVQDYEQLYREITCLN